MSFTASTGDVLQQVDQFWSMLDDLCQNDPGAYRQFIEKQMKEGAEHRAPPELHSSLCTELLEPEKGLLYINICSWKRVPEPQDPSKPLPVCTGKLETDTNEGWYAVLDVALNTSVLQECKKDQNEMKQLYMMVMRLAQQQHGFRLSHQYSVISCSPKSSPDDLHRRLRFQQRPNTAEHPNKGSQTPAAFLQQISTLRSEEEDPELQIIPRSVEHKNKGLIQVISTTFEPPQKPEYQLEVKTDTAGVPRNVELTVELPKVRSMAECDLKISTDDVLLEVEDVYYLLLEFPRPVLPPLSVVLLHPRYNLPFPARDDSSIMKYLHSNMQHLHFQKRLTSIMQNRN